MKRFFAIILFCSVLISCSATKEEMPVQILAQKLGEEINDFENLTEASDDYIKKHLNSDLSLYSEYIVLYSSSSAVKNELGIFKVKDMNDISKGMTEVKKYINANCSKNIEKASFTRYGKYILFTILSLEESNNVERKFRAELR